MGGRGRLTQQRRAVAEEVTRARAAASHLAAERTQHELDRGQVLDEGELADLEFVDAEVHQLGLGGVHRVDGDLERRGVFEQGLPTCVIEGDPSV